MLILITSCIFPQVGTSRLSYDPTTRANDLIKASFHNVKYLLEANIYVYKYVLVELLSTVESEQYFFLNDFVPRFKKQMAIAGLSGSVIGVKLNREDIANIHAKGKGYAEMLLLKEFFIKTNYSEHILKISGRYQIKNIAEFVLSYLEGRNEFGISRSILLRRATAHCNLFTRESFERFNEMFGPHIDDRYLTIESALYKYCLLTPSVARLQYPEPSPETRSGATGLKYGHFKNILRKIAYNYF